MINPFDYCTDSAMECIEWLISLSFEEKVILFFMITVPLFVILRIFWVITRDVN